jgi:hypothetical protein
MDQQPGYPPQQPQYPPQQPPYPPQQQYAPPVATPPKKKSKVWWFCGCGCLLFVVVIIAIILLIALGYSSTSTRDGVTTKTTLFGTTTMTADTAAKTAAIPDKVFDSFLGAIEEKDTKSAYDNYTSSTFKSATSAEEFAKILVDFPGLKDQQSQKGAYTPASEDKSTYEFKGEIWTNYGIYDIQATFSKENGGWVVDSFTVTPRKK